MLTTLFALRRGRRGAASVIAAACLAMSAPSLAADPPPDVPGKAPLPIGAKRAAPDYDGRGGRPATAGDAALWVPRVVLFPAYLASEYVVRKPLGLVVTAAEQGKWIKELTEIFTFGPDGNIGVVPTALIDFGLRSSVGVYFFYDDLGAPGNDLRVHAATGGSDWLRLTVADRVRIDDDASVKFRAEGWRRPDGVFYGIGPRSRERDRSRFGADTLAGGMSFTTRLGPAVTLDASTSVKSVRFRADTCCDDTSLELRLAQERLTRPAGYAEGYAAYAFGLKLAADSRAPRPAPGTGVRVELEAENDFNLDDPSEGRWVRYGGTVGGFLDLTQHNRVLGLAVTTLFVDPLGDDEVPFTELVSLGGDTHMRGLLGGRVIGRSAATATLEYRYPIWAFLDGSLAVSAGNAFSEHLEDFDPELLRLSFWAGVRSAGERDHSFDLLVGTGTETFADGTHLNDARVVLGAKKGF